MRYLWAALAILALAVIGCTVEPTEVIDPCAPTPTTTIALTACPTENCGAVVDPLWTVVAEQQATVSWVETLAAEMIPTCGALWDCCANATLAAQTPTPTATDTPEPTDTPQLGTLCDTCLPPCTGGLICYACADGVNRCVSPASPNGNCNGCQNGTLP